MAMTQESALKTLKTGANVFITGEPGSGKTYVINEYVSYLRGRGISPAITASTGIAATHIGGMTIHSWSGIGIKKTLTPYDLDKIATNERTSKRISRAKVLIIDEISMLSPDTLNSIDMVCREVRKSQDSFGGLQVVFVGDFFQLPPVRKLTESERDPDLFNDRGEFAFDSSAWSEAKPLVCYLSEQYRQSDEIFLGLLRAIRNCSVRDEHRKHLNARVAVLDEKKHQSITKLFPHNENVDSLNERELKKLAGREYRFDMKSFGRPMLVEALKRGCLSPEELRLKIGAVVMFTKNNFEEGFVNGTLGKVIDFDSDTGLPVVKTRKGEIINVEEMEWTVEENGAVLAKVVQLPLRLAWAMTVHKSQGITLDSAYIDLRQAFVEGQGYVALSRVRELSGLHLAGYNEESLKVHQRVTAKDAELQALSLEVDEIFRKMSDEEVLAMHVNFIKACGGSETAGGMKQDGSHGRKSGKEKTLESIRNGLRVEEIAERSGLTMGTIIKHIEDSLLKGKLSRSEIRYLIDGRESEIREVHEALASSAEGRLKPVFENLEGKYSYDFIRLARLLFAP